MQMIQLYLNFFQLGLFPEAYGNKQSAENITITNIVVNYVNTNRIKKFSQL